MKPTRDRFQGCLLGGALGDALGYPVEFIDTETIERRYGTAAPAHLAYAGPAPARISDDTQMTLFSAEGLLRAGGDPEREVESVARAYLRWHRTQGHPNVDRTNEGWLFGRAELWSQRAPGRTCMSALAKLDLAHLPLVDDPPNDSKGCGAVMRAAPFGLWARDRARAFTLGVLTGVLTHGHPSGYLSSGCLAALTWDLVRGASLPGAVEDAMAILRTHQRHEEQSEALARALKLAERGPPSAKTIESLGGGWVGEEALAIGVLCAATADRRSPEGAKAALWRAAAHGGDSDSTAAICGNLLGAELGLARLPQDWLAELELREVTDRIATDLHAAAEGGAVDAERYPPP